MVLGLPGEIALHPLLMRVAHCERAITDLPGEPRQVGNGLMNPAGRIRLHGTQGLGDGNLFVERHEKMHVIGHTTRRQKGGALGSEDPTEVSIKARLESRRDERGPVFCREDQMMMNASERLGHAGLACEGGGTRGGSVAPSGREPPRLMFTRALRPW